jgi:TrmH family RNA methyltransferase
MLGRHHATLRRLRALRRDAALRRSEQVFLAEGVHLAQEALASAAPVELALTSPRLARTAEGRELLERLARSGIERAETTDAALDGVQDARAPQPIVMVVRRQPRSLDTTLAAAGPAPLLLVAHGVQDPGNLGALLRTADGAGAAAFVTAGDSADLYHPRAVRATMGSIFRLPALDADTEPLLETLRRTAIRTWGADPGAELDHRQVDLRGAMALFVGGEGAGLPRTLADRLDGRLRIPLRAGVESLSVGAAAAVLLFEALRQRGG